MKKIMLIVSVITILFLLNKKNYQIEPVFNETKNIALYYLSFEKEKLTTKNFENYFKDIDVITIYPYINPIYRLKANQLAKYNFSAYSLKNNINKFIKDYQFYLETNCFKNDLINIELQGIRINKVSVYIDNEQLLKFKEKHPLVNYSVDNINFH